jgi:hypothetical protein
LRAVIEGKLYDTETAELVHRKEGDPGLGFAQSLYETPNGNFFYVYEYPGGAWRLFSFEDPTCVYRSWAQRRGFEDYERDGAAFVWCERHGGTEVILERWPERAWAG